LSSTGTDDSGASDDSAFALAADVRLAGMLKQMSKMKRQTQAKMLNREI
jgi:hypothetical protein